MTRGWILISIGWALTGCSTTVCEQAAAVSDSCGGHEVADPTIESCEEAVASACTPAESEAYIEFLSCADDRCANHSPSRKIAENCDAHLDGVSAACFAAGIVGNSDYRYCGEGTLLYPDHCPPGYVCQDSDCQVE